MPYGIPAGFMMQSYFSVKFFFLISIELSGLLQANKQTTKQQQSHQNMNANKTIPEWDFGL